ncbi:MAG: hypothetical protein Q9188_003853 [Gyalolechia gomerana]
MKEEALKDFDAPLMDFDRTDILPPENPVRIVLHPARSAASDKLKRSTVMWTLQALAVELMRTRYLRPMVFSTHYYVETVYLGVLMSPLGDAIVSPRPNTAPPLSLLPAQVDNSTTMRLSSPRSAIRDDIEYQVNFHFVGETLGQFRIFESIMALLLQLGKSEAASIVELASVDSRNLQAWIFIQEVPSPIPTFAFQQYHAVALLEAIARYYVLHALYTEMTFELRMGGYRMAWGCVTRAVGRRHWCRHMFPDARGEEAGLVTTS